MAKTFILKVSKVTYSPNAPFMVRIPPGLWQLEGQKKKFFAKESVAKAYKDRLTRLTVNYQLQAAALSDTQRMEAFECFAKLEPLGASLRSAVDHYVAYLDKAGKSISVREFFPEFLANKEQDGASRRYVADLRSKLGRFAVEFGKRLMCDITSQEIDSWLRGLDVNVTSRDSYRRNMGVMFEMARQRGYCTQNPAADIRFKHRLKGEVTILAAGQLRQLLKKCASELVPYITICAFAGLRPTEAASLDWSDIHLDSSQIEVRARHSKTRRHRLVPIQPNLKAWLETYRKDAGVVAFSRRKFRDAYRNAGFAEWPLDVLRHSYGTYRLPILKSAESLALEMGNSPDVIFRHYRRAMDEKTAAEYFKIEPRDRIQIESNPGDDSLSEKLVDGERRDAPALLEADRSKAA